MMIDPKCEPFMAKVADCGICHSRQPVKAAALGHCGGKDHLSKEKGVAGQALLETAFPIDRGRTCEAIFHFWHIPGLQMTVFKSNLTEWEMIFMPAHFRTKHCVINK